MTFADTDLDLNDAIDAAYRDKIGGAYATTGRRPRRARSRAHRASP
jgi:hypothetical protein